jgi:hypothetical protein
MRPPSSRRLPVRVGGSTLKARRALLALSMALSIAVLACAPKVRLDLPVGTGTPLVDAAAAEQAARASCQTHSAVTADLRLSGRIDGERVRGTLQVGVTRDAMRLEGLAPFGAPVFILAARPGSATLLLPRESAVARSGSAAELLDAVVGVALSPADLLAIVSGCGVSDWEVTGGASFGGGWTRLDLDRGRALWLRTGDGGTLLVGAQDSRWRIEYTRTTTGWPTAIRLRPSGTADAATRTDAVLALEAPEALTALPEGALEVDVPAGARELSLTDLRRSRGLTEH